MRQRPRPRTRVELGDTELLNAPLAGGAKGIGEMGIVGTAAAIANAVHHATGLGIRELPIRLDRLVGRI